VFTDHGQTSEISFSFAFFHAREITKQSIALGLDVTLWKETKRAKKSRNIIIHH